MKNKDVLDMIKQKFGQDFLAAIHEGDEEKVTNVFTEFCESMQNQMMEDAANHSADAAIMAQRGVRQLTSEETKFWNDLIGAMKSDNPKQAITNLDKAMPMTIIDEVIKQLKQEFPLLAKLDLVNTTAITKWIFNKKGLQKAVWSKLGSRITEELGGELDVIETGMYKLTAFMAISKDFLKLGPVWLDTYVRNILTEAIGYGMEDAAVTGDGSTGPIGMDRDMSAGVTDEGVTTYPKKNAITVNDFLPKTYGDLVSRLAKDPTGRDRKIPEVILIANQTTILKKIMPASTAYAAGGYVTNVFPYPTDVVPAISVPDNEAIIGIPSQYLMTVGARSSVKGFIEYQDVLLDDMRNYATHFYGNGRPKDNLSFLRLNVANLKDLISVIADMNKAEA